MTLNDILNEQRIYAMINDVPIYENLRFISLKN